MDIGPAGDWQLELGVDPAARAQAIFDLYEALSSAAGWLEWLVARDGDAAAEKLTVLIEPSTSKTAFHAQAAELERLNLAPILGFAVPHRQLLVRLRARAGGCRGRAGLPPRCNDRR